MLDKRTHASVTAALAITIAPGLTLGLGLGLGLGLNVSRGPELDVDLGRIDGEDAAEQGCRCDADRAPRRALEANGAEAAHGLQHDAAR